MTISLSGGNLMSTQAVSPYTMRRTRVAHVQVIGKVWMPSVTCAMEYPLSDYDLENIGKFTRRNVELWLCTHAGDFQSVEDFRAVCGDKVIEWRKGEDSECTFCDCMYPAEE